MFGVSNKVNPVDIEIQESRMCYKVIACDAREEMIELQASLMMGVALSIAQF